ncbi:MAG TPA: hypothetical protein VHO50_12315 [Bacteroidales bacterium]|nr:hypothetical protein [Bacteroidales bacterium]
MELARNIRLKIGNSLLNKKVGKASRKATFEGIESVRRIGIVWDATQVDEFKNLSRFCQKMSERNVDVKVLGYFPGKNLPDQYTAIRYLSCIRREEVNFFYLPVSPESESFIKDRFDILIDMNFKDLVPLKYMVYLSNAAFKIGLFESENDGKIFDLMMDMKKPVDVGIFLDQTLHYLEMINPKKTESITH